MAGRGLVSIIAVSLFCSIANMAFGEQIVVDIGANETTAMRGFGWREQNERIGTNSFCWINGLEADLHINIPEVRNYKVDIFARAFYYGNCKQRFALFVNNNFVKEWTCRQYPEWTFDRYSAIISADFLTEGPNRFIIRSSYAAEIGDPGLSLAVDRLILRDVEGLEENLWGFRMVRLVVLAVLVTLLGVIILYFRKRK